MTVVLAEMTKEISFKRIDILNHAFALVNLDFLNYQIKMDAKPMDKQEMSIYFVK